MMINTREIGLGGGCHWCTEAVFSILKGVAEVEQGYIASTGRASSFSEGIIVHYEPAIITLESLIEIHLYTHQATSKHSFREKYRSAIYFMDAKDEISAKAVLKKLQRDFKQEIITEVLPFKQFKPSRTSLQDYYFSDPERPFCQRYIDPKLKMLREKFKKELN